jgi:hypothetical protein
MGTTRWERDRLRGSVDIFSDASWLLKRMKDLLQVRRIPVKEDHSFPVPQEPSEQLSELLEEMREVVSRDRDLHDKVC